MNMKRPLLECVDLQMPKCRQRKYEPYLFPAELKYRMGILGVGVDLLHSPRITQLLNRRGPTRFASRVLSLEEISQWKALPTSDQARFLAVRCGNHLDYCSRA
jgi:hypothetical protein